MRGRKIPTQIEIRDLLYQIYGNIYLFITRGEARPFEMQHEKYFWKIFFQDISKIFCEKWVSGPILWKIFFSNIYLFIKNILSQEGRKSQFSIEIRDLLYQIYGNIYLFITRGEPRPFEMHQKIFWKIFFRKYFCEKYFSQDFDSPYFTWISGPFVPNLR